MAHILPDLYAARFPNPCPVCGADDDHAARMQGTLESGFACTVCPHPEQPGHGTGCCCAGLSAGKVRADAEASQREWEASTFDAGPLLGTGPVHDRTGTEVHAARIGGESYRATLKVMTWTGCNGQRCARDCGPGHHVVLWVPCRFAVGHGHHYTVSGEEIAALRDVLGRLPHDAPDPG